MKSKSTYISVGIALLVAMAGIAGAAWYKNNNKPEVYTQLKPSVQNPNSLKVITSSYSEIDSDADGLKDWEESLWGSDPKKVDTDDDGISDGEEVASNRNPTIKGPNDSTTTFPIGSTQQTSSSTVTDLFSQATFDKYLKYREGGLALSESERNEVINSMLQSLNEIKIKATVYTRNDLVISNDNSRPAILRFAEELKTVVQKNTLPLENHELVVLESAILQNSSSPLKNITAIKESYDLFIQELLAINTPSAISAQYINYINAISSKKATFSTFDKIFEDPAIVLTNLSTYYTNQARFQSAYTELNSSLATYGASII